MYILTFPIIHDSYILNILCRKEVYTVFDTIVDKQYNMANMKTLI